MARITLTLFFLSIQIQVFPQQDPLSAFDNLINKTWLIEGQWENGMNFKQETTFNKTLEGNLIIAESMGYINQEQTKWGKRNHGVRRYDTETQQLEFYEYDAFGGLTQGVIKVEGKDLIYVYAYGEQMLADKWQYISDEEYKFIVGTYNNGKLDMILLEGKATVKR